MSTQQTEINALINLIEKREAWLADPTNQRRGTFKAIKADTAELKIKLADIEQSEKHAFEVVC